MDGTPVVHLLTVDPEDPGYDEVFTRCCRYNWRSVIGSGLVTAHPELVTCPGRSTLVPDDGTPVVTKRGTVLTREDLEALAAEAERGYDVLGADAGACCLMHRRVARWIPNPGWWIHEPDWGGPYRNAGGYGDPRSCPGMWNLPAPIVLVPHEEDS